MTVLEATAKINLTKKLVRNVEIPPSRRRQKFSKINRRQPAKESKNSKWCVARRNGLRLVIARNQMKRKNSQNSRNDESSHENSGNDEFDSVKSEDYFEFSNNIGNAENILLSNENYDKIVDEEFIQACLKDASYFRKVITLDFPKLPKKFVKTRMNTQDQNIFENCYYSYFTNSSIVSERVINFDEY